MSTRVSFPSIMFGLVLTLTIAVTLPTRGAELTLTLTYLGSNKPDFSSPFVLDLCGDLDQAPLEPTDIHNFAVWMELTDTAPGEDFQAVQYDVDLGPGAAPADFGGSSQWTANNPLVDLNGPLPPGPASLFSDNRDIGSSDHDLIRILSLIGSRDQAAEVQAGEGGPFLLGDFWVTGNVWSVLIGPSSELSPNIELTPNGGLPWGIWTGEIAVAQPDSSFHYGGFVHPGCVPEPASGLLAALAALGLASSVRRRV